MAATVVFGVLSAIFAVLAFNVRWRLWLFPQQADLREMILRAGNERCTNYFRTVPVPDKILRVPVLVASPRAGALAKANSASELGRVLSDNIQSLCVSGPAGSGKSLLIHGIYKRLIKRASDSQDHVPFLLFAAELLPYIPDLQGALVKVISRRLLVPQRSVQQHLPIMVILIDGFDEVSESAQARLETALKRHFLQFPGQPVIGLITNEGVAVL